MGEIELKGRGQFCHWYWALWSQPPRGPYCVSDRELDEYSLSSCHLPKGPVGTIKR